MTKTVYHGSAPITAFLASVSVLVLLLASRPSLAQPTAGLEPGHTWSDLGIGLGVHNAALRFQGRQYQALPRDMEIETSLAAVPAAALLARHWLDRSFGLSFSAALGYLPALEIPADKAVTADGKQATLQLWTREVQAQLLYRLHFSGTPRAPALQAALGFDLLGYVVQETDPAVLVSTSYVGPTASAGLHLPLGSSFCITLTAGAFLPFYVQEEPVDSGRVDDSFAWSLDLAAELLLGKELSLELTARRVDVATSYTDHGSRGVSGHGVFDGEAQDTFHQAGVNLRYRL